MKRDCFLWPYRTCNCTKCKSWNEGCQNLHKITIAFTGQILSRKAHDKSIIYANDFAEGLSRDCRNL